MTVAASHHALDKRALWKSIEADARRDRRAAVRAAKAICRADRLAARERVRELRARAKEETNAAAAAIRAGARDKCGSEVGAAKEAARAELAVQRTARRLETKHAPPKRARGARAAEARGESDDEVRANIDPELLALFDKVRRSIKGSARMSRTEEFLQYAEEHPDEVLESLEGDVDARLAVEIARMQNPDASDAEDDARLREFASSVYRAAALVPASSPYRFGRYKIFLAFLSAANDAAELATGRHPSAPNKVLARLLLRAQQAGYITLARFDLSPAAPRAMQDASRVTRGHAEFHVLDTELGDGTVRRNPNPRRKGHNPDYREGAGPSLEDAERARTHATQASRGVVGRIAGSRKVATPAGAREAAEAWAVAADVAEQAGDPRAALSRLAAEKYRVLADLLQTRGFGLATGESLDATINGELSGLVRSAVGALAWEQKRPHVWRALDDAGQAHVVEVTKTGRITVKRASSVRNPSGAAAAARATYKATHGGQVGASKTITMRVPDPKAGPLVKMGALRHVVTDKHGRVLQLEYETDKGHGEELYFHNFGRVVKNGRETGRPLKSRLPVLVFNADGLFIAGGQYTVKPEGITG